MRIIDWSSDVCSSDLVDQRLASIEGPIARIDLSAVSEIDTVGAWLSCRLTRQHGAQITGASARAQRLLNAVEHCESEHEFEPPVEPFWLRVPRRMGIQIGRAHV